MRGSCEFRNGSPSLRNLPLKSAAIPSESCTPSNSHSQQQKCKEQICFHSALEAGLQEARPPKGALHTQDCRARGGLRRKGCHGVRPGTSSFYQSVCLTEFHFTNLLQEAAWVFHICLGLPVETGSLHIQIQPPPFFFSFSFERSMLVHSYGALVCGCQHGSFGILSQVPPIKANTEFRSLAVG